MPAMAKRTESEAAEAERSPASCSSGSTSVGGTRSVLASWRARSVRWGRRTSSTCSRRLRPARHRLCARGCPDRLLSARRSSVRAGCCSLAPGRLGIPSLGLEAEAEKRGLSSELADFPEEDSLVARAHCDSATGPGRRSVGSSARASTYRAARRSAGKLYASPYHLCGIFVALSRARGVVDPRPGDTNDPGCACPHSIPSVTTATDRSWICPGCQVTIPGERGRGGAPRSQGSGRDSARG
jgi:hypothetical protein